MTLRTVYPSLSRAFNADGEVVKVKGYVEATDLSKPGQLTLHLDGVPGIFGAPYWIVALGDEDGVRLLSTFKVVVDFFFLSLEN